MSPVVGNVDQGTPIDCWEVDRQLQESLDHTCGPSDLNPPESCSRKHRRSPSNLTFESEYLSEVSGQFDDAEESDSSLGEPSSIPATTTRNHDSPSSHSIKRRRSNDWPRRSPQVTDDELTARREQASGRRHRWHFHYGKQSSSAHGSPRSPRRSRTPRRSRFVEGYMNDSVSVKPPSIFLHDEPRTDTSGTSSSRHSGIFRFGKAIASAFNPFGGWGNVSDILKGSHDATQQQVTTDDRLRQAERAYEELKRSGYKGTIKGSYMQGLRTTGGGLPDQTWRSIQEKMSYTDEYPSRQSLSHGQEPGNSLRSPLPDLRKTKSSLGIPSIKRSDGKSSLLQHFDGRSQEIRHQKSRKELQRQAKLLKRVSDLEEKLQRARRELRELTGDNDLPMRAASSEISYPRKFVPGALPSLPSERLIQHNDQLGPLSELPGSPSPRRESNSASRVIEGPCQDQDHGEGRRHVTPKPRREVFSQSQTCRTSDSPSLKRKSPNPESRKVTPVLDSQSHQDHPSTPANLGDSTSIALAPATDENAAAALTTSTPEQHPTLRRTKLPKNTPGDSPGSVERKQKQKQRLSSPSGEETPRALRSANARNRSATPVLRMRKGRTDLRSASGTAPSPVADENKENQEDYNSNVKEIADSQDENELGPHDSLDTENPTPSPTPGRKTARYEYIPPVPPLPKDIAATAAKVNRRLAREMGKRQLRTGKRQGGRQGFQWPEDIF